MSKKSSPQIAEREHLNSIRSADSNKLSTEIEDCRSEQEFELAASFREIISLRERLSSAEEKTKSRQETIDSLRKKVSQLESRINILFRILEERL